MDVQLIKLYLADKVENLMKVLINALKWSLYMCVYISLTDNCLLFIFQKQNVAGTIKGRVIGMIILTNVTWPQQTQEPKPVLIVGIGEWKYY